MGLRPLQYRDMRKKAQAEIPMISAVVLIIILLIMTPIMFKVFNSVVGGFKTSMAPGNPLVNETITTMTSQYNNFFDFLMIMAIVILIAVLFLTAYFIYTHPIFLVFYIIIVFVMIMLLPNFQDLLTNIYTSPALAGGGNETYSLETHAPYTSFIVNNFAIFMIAMIIISGIIAYGKARSETQRMG